MVFGDEDKILIKSLYLNGYSAKRLTDEFPEKSWTRRCQHGVDKLLKKSYSLLTHKYTQDTHIEELKSVHLECNLFAFFYISISAEYVQKI